MLIWHRISYCSFHLMLAVIAAFPLVVGIYLHLWAAAGVYILAWLGLFSPAISGYTVRAAISCCRNGDNLEIVFPFGKKQISFEQIVHFCLLPARIGIRGYISGVGGLFFRKGLLLIQIRGEKRLIQIPADDTDNSILRILKNYAKEEVSYEAIFNRPGWKNVVFFLLFAVIMIGWLYSIYTLLPQALVE